MSCKDCELKHCTTNCMDGVGLKKAKTMLVMDFPNEGEDDVGEPWHGDHGKKLSYLVKKAGLKRKHLFTTFAVRCKPWNRNVVKAVHMRACQKHLFKEILKERPKVIVASGKWPLQALIGETATKSFRGHFTQIEIAYKKNRKNKVFKAWVIPTYGVGACLAKWEFDEYFVHDLKKAHDLATTGQLPKKLSIDWELVTDMKALKRVRKELLSAKSLTYDFETTGLKFFKDKVVMAGFCPRPGRAIIIPNFVYDLEDHGKKWDQENKLMGERINNFVKKHKGDIWDVLNDVLSSDIPKNGHNAKFDDKFARALGILVKKWDFDTIIGHSLVDENKFHDLTFCLEWYGINHLSEDGYTPYDHDLWPFVNKEKKKPYSYAPPLILALYLGKDVDGSHRLKPILKKQIKKERLWKLFKGQQMPLARLLSDFEFRGVKADVDLLQDMSKRFNDILSDLEKKMKKMVGTKSFNSNSPAQVLEYFERVDAPLEKKTKSRDKYSTDKQVLESFAKSRRKWGKFSRLLVQHREISKLKGTYLDGQDGASGILQHTSQSNKIHTNYNPHTPRTGRLSSNEPNLQNIPRPNPK